MAATPTFPKVIMLIPKGTRHSVAATGVFEGLDDAVYMESQLGYLNPMAKIEVEAAKIDSRYVHLRYAHTNKYWSQGNAKERFIVAGSKVPEEDRTKLSCTLFEPIASAAGGGTFELIHVQSGDRVICAASLHFAVTNEANPREVEHVFGFVDWETLTKVPQHVALKGSNGKYLKVFRRDDKPFLQFSSDDPNEQGSGYQVTQQLGGRDLIVKSNDTGKFWIVSPDWILADNVTGGDAGCVFEPVRVDANTIALKNVSNEMFCRLLTSGRVTDCLNAGSPTIINEARLEVHELVSERRICDVKYRFDEARIYNESPYAAGESTVHNNTDQVANHEVLIKYQDEKSYTFSRGFSVAAGVTTTIQAGVPFIARTGISISFEISGNFQWDTTTSRTVEASATTSVAVPARSSAVIKYVGTKGSCSIPYSYTQQDRMSTNGEIVNIPQIDGVYTGVSLYNFDFVIDKVVPL